MYKRCIIKVDLKYPTVFIGIFHLVSKFSCGAESLLTVCPDIFDVPNLRDHHGFVPFGGVGRAEPADLHLPHNPPPVRNSGQLIRRSLQGKPPQSHFSS
jgi:hypothetical protein